MSGVAERAGRIMNRMPDPLPSGMFTRALSTTKPHVRKIRPIQNQPPKIEVIMLAIRFDHN